MIGSNHQHATPFIHSENHSWHYGLNHINLTNDTNHFQSSEMEKDSKIVNRNLLPSCQSTCPNWIIPNNHSTDPITTLESIYRYSLHSKAHRSSLPNSLPSLISKWESIGLDYINTIGIPSLKRTIPLVHGLTLWSKTRAKRASSQSPFAFLGYRDDRRDAIDLQCRSFVPKISPSLSLQQDQSIVISNLNQGQIYPTMKVKGLRPLVPSHDQLQKMPFPTLQTLVSSFIFNRNEIIYDEEGLVEEVTLSEKLLLVGMKKTFISLDDWILNTTRNTAKYCKEKVISGSMGIPNLSHRIRGDIVLIDRPIRRPFWTSLQAFYHLQWHKIFLKRTMSLTRSKKHHWIKKEDLCIKNCPTPHHQSSLANNQDDPEEMNSSIDMNRNVKCSKLNEREDFQQDCLLDQSQKELIQGNSTMNSNLPIHSILMVAQSQDDVVLNKQRIRPKKRRSTSQYLARLKTLPVVIDRPH